MATEISCPSCQTRLRIADGSAGRRVRCPRCQEIIEAPGADMEAAMIADLPPQPPPRQPFVPFAGDEPRPESWRERDEEAGVRVPRPTKKLGSLAQSARGKHLRTVRIILIVIGILQLLVGIPLAAYARPFVEGQVKQELVKKGPGFIADPVKVEESVRLVRLGAIVTAAVGAVNLFFAVIVYLYPVPVTIAALVLYVANVLVGVVANPQALVSPCTWLIPTLIIIAMVKAVQAAIAYQRQRNAEDRWREEPEEEYA